LTKKTVKNVKNGFCIYSCLSLVYWWKDKPCSASRDSVWLCTRCTAADQTPGVYTGTRRSAVPANIFEPERRSGKYCLRLPERWYCSVPANQLVLL